MDMNNSNQLIIQKAHSQQWKVVTTCELPIAIYSLCDQDPTDTSAVYPIWKLQVEETGCIHYSLLCSNPTWKIETVHLSDSSLIVSCRDGTVSIFRDSRVQKEYHLPIDRIGVTILQDSDYSFIVDDVGDVYSLTEDWKRVGRLGPATSQHTLIENQLVYMKQGAL